MLLIFLTLTFVLIVTKSSDYTRDERFNSISISDKAMKDFPFASRLLCAGLCNVNRGCTSFIHNILDGRCRLFSELSGAVEDKTFDPGVTFYRRIGVCDVPLNISNGRLRSFNGLMEGSRALFNCDDFYFTNISHGVCRADGVWEGLDKPCVKAKAPYILQSKNRMVPGKCVTFFATTNYERKWPKFVFKAKGVRKEILHSSFRFDESIIIRNTFINGKWGYEQKHTPHWPLTPGQEANITVCIEESCFRGFVDGVQMFIFKHRVPVNEIDIMLIHKFHVRRITFTDWTR